MTSALVNYRTQNDKSFFLFSLQVLCKLDPAQPLISPRPAVDSPTQFYNSIYLSGFAVSHTGMIPKNPLRLIVARTPIFYELHSIEGTRLCWFLDTLECGHQQWTLNLDVPDIGKTRHRCGECAAAAARKKPAASVPAPVERKKAA